MRAAAVTWCWWLFVCAAIGGGRAVVCATNFNRVLQSATISIPLTIQENVGASISSSSIFSVVVPFTESTIFDISTLGIQEGNPIQVEILERWVSDDSIRHALVHILQVTELQANERKIIHLQNTTPNSVTPSTQNAVVVSDTESYLQVDTGKIRFRISKKTFNIIDELWLDLNDDGIYKGDEQMIATDSENGAKLVSRDGTTQWDSNRSDLTIKIEEGGPLRAVIRVSAPTLFVTTTDHLHGFCVRIYAYANSPVVKLDYQLQNSDGNVVRSWPLYFKEMSIDLNFLQPSKSVTLGGTDGTTYSTTTIPSHIKQTRHNAYSIYEGSSRVVTHDNLSYPDIRRGAGFLHLQQENAGITTVLRNMWQTWPNGLSVSSESKVSIEMFPKWSAQWLDKAVSETDLYWLDDMQHVYKELLFVFHSTTPTSDDMIDLASTFQFPPVVTVPPDWYRTTRATLDLGGFLPADVDVQPNEDTVSPDMYWLIYGSPIYAFDDQSHNYAGNWVNFGDPEPGYRNKPCQAGGFPYVAEELVASQYSSHFFLYETWGIGELNVRPQWLPTFNWEMGQTLLQLTENPYCNGEWRTFENYGPVLIAPLLPGTEVENDHDARDDAHGWFYHAALSYFYTGNYWMRDWYEFVAQFRRVFLTGGDPFPDMASRAVGHALSRSAVRITGDTELLVLLESFFKNTLRPRQDILYGSEFNATTSAGPGGGGFQTGYLMRAIINYMNLIENQDPQLYAELFQYISGLMEWNRLHCHFAYYYSQYIDGASQGISHGTGQTIIDPQAWYFWQTGKSEYWDHIERYMQTGINGGKLPYGAPWLIYHANGWNGRLYHFIRQNMRSNLTPPSAVTDLTASSDNLGVQLEWTTPADAVRYHIVWSDKPIVEQQSSSSKVINWWAANPIALVTSPSEGTLQAFQLNVQSSEAVFVAVFSFDQSRNMSPMSNVAQVDQINPPTTTGPTPLSPNPTSIMLLEPTLVPSAPDTSSPMPEPTPTPTIPPPAQLAINIYSGDSFESAVEKLLPGDTLIVHEGDYFDSGRISIKVLGSPDNPVVIKGADGEARPRILRSPSALAQNTMNVEGASHLTIRGLEIMSNGGDGVKFAGDGNVDIILEDLLIHAVAVGINVQTNINRLTVRKSHIYDTSGSGEGMYLGCHDGSCIVTNSLFENNLVHDTAGSSQGDGIEIKKNSYNNIVRDNVIFNTNYPCILLCDSGIGPQNVVEGNVMWNCALGGIQVAADAIIRNNLVFNSGFGLLSQPHNGVSPKNLRIVHNTFVNHETCLNIRAWGGRSDIVFSNNAVYCSSDTMDLRGGTDNVQFGGNVFFPRAAAFPIDSYALGQGMDVDFVDARALNAYPTVDSALLNAAVLSYSVEEDFDGISRGISADVGAYDRTPAGRLWAVMAEFKSATPVATASPTPLSPQFSG